MRIALETALSRTDPSRLITICWPTPDKVCLQGGCIHCQDSVHRLRVSAVAAYAEENGMAEDFAYGLERNWSDR